MTKPHQPCFIRRPMPSTVERIHLIGIAGSGMGAFACMLQEAGFEVRGSDQNVYPPMSDILSARGIQWMESWRPEHLDWTPELVIVGNVCRSDNPEAVEAEARGIPCVSFPQALSDLFLVDRTPVVITGTHGKTTTTTLTTYLLHRCGLEPGMLVGGVAQNFGKTYLIGASGAPFVVEGDEYDTAFFDKGPKFLHYRPKIAVLNNIEFDHADIYDDLDEIIENFDRLMNILGPDTVLLANGDDPLVMARAEQAEGRVVTYGFREGVHLRAIDVQPGPTGCRFTLMRGGKVIGDVQSPMAGRHNVWNTLAAFGACFELGLPFEVVVAGLPGFKGAQKRQEEKGEINGVLVIDDYAHHPTAIRETLAALRHRYPGRRMWGVYEPKSNTARRNIHQRAYTESFDAADEVLLAKPYVKKDGLSQAEMLDVDALVKAISARGTPARYRPDVDGVLDYLLANTAPGDVVVIMANSGFGGLNQKLLAGLEAQT
ncbi:MAG: Mur ligase family protein [Myxococcota bacterium]|nr:Mur ligase family protein [Myxococcota bacterium]